MKDKTQYVIGIDGGGTKTVAVLADLKGKTLKRVETGSTNPNKIGFEKAIFNLKKIIAKITKSYSKDKIGFCYLGLAGGLERDEEKREKIKNFLEKEFSFPVKVEGDQKIAFRSGTDAQNGLLIISGTGSISMGWRKKREAIAGGWDWLLGDQGSAFWAGKRTLEEVAKSFDGRKPATKLQNLIFRKWKIKEEKDLYQKFYGPDFVEKTASVSKILDSAVLKGEKIVKKILKEAGKELAQMAISVVKKLKFKEEFPIVLVGGMFKSKIVLKTVKKEMRKYARGARFVRPKKEPVVGAVKLALESLNKLETQSENL